MEVFKKHKKIFITLIVAGVIGILMLFDFIWSKTYKIKVENIDPPNPVCSGMNAGEIETVHLTLRVTHFGSPVAGHNLVAYSLIDNETAGGFIQNVVKTDKDGYAVFEYTVYAQAPFSEVRPVEFYIFDENNSIFFEINTEIRFNLEIRPREGVAL